MSLKAGVFVQENGDIYSVYKIDIGAYSRIDFVTHGANFQVDVSAVRYSRVTSGKVHTYGDDSIYTAYMNLLTKTHAHFDTITPESDWVNGVFMETITHEALKSQLVYKTRFENGILMSEDLIFGKCAFSLNVQSLDYNIKLQPMNFAEYTVTALLKDTNEATLSTPFYPLSTLKQMYDLRHIAKKDYVVCDGDDLELARKRLHEWENSPCVLKGIDTETTGTDVCMIGEDHLVGVILGIGTQSATYFAFNMESMPNLPHEFLDELITAVKANKDYLVWYNGKFDRQVFKKEGYDVTAKWDAMLLSILVNPVVNRRGTHALKDKTDRLTQKHFLTLEEIFPDASLINFAILPKDLVLYYACPDVTNTVLCFEHDYKLLPADAIRLLEHECYLVQEKADEEYYGCRVDVKKYMENHENCDYTVNMLLDMFKKLTREEGNINSSDFLSTLIYDKMHCPVLMRTKTGRRSTAGKAIEKLGKIKRHEEVTGIANVYDLIGTRKLAEGASPDSLKEHLVLSGSDLGKAKYPALLVLDKYKEFNKRKTAFYARFERTIRIGRIFFWINQYGAASGRQSSPMHQLPPELKKVILQDGNEWNLFGADFGQVELRMMAYNAGETELIKLAMNPKNDIHRIIGSLISGKEMYEISPEERSIGKRRNFGVIYLISAYGLAGQLFGAGYTEENVKFAQQQLDAFFNRFKRIKRYIARNKYKILTEGKIRTICGRTRYFPEVFDSDTTARQLASIIRQGNNMPVQGSAADLMKLAECNFSHYIHERNWHEEVEGFPKVRVMLSIHDEVLISAHKSIPLEEIIKMIRECMEINIKGAPPFFVSPALMDSWGDHTNDALTIPIELRDNIIAEYEKTGVSKLNCENYRRVLDTYRKKCIDDYMHELIDKYGSDYHEVGAHVRDGALTFDLLELYAKQLKPLKLEHKENIIEATRLYMQGVTADMPQTREHDTIEDNLSADIETLVNFDANGDVIYDAELEEEDIDAYMYDDNTDENYINQFEQQYLYSWELADTIVIDCSNLSEEDTNKVLAKAYEQKDDNGFFEVRIIFGDKLLDTGFRVEEFDHNAITQLITDISDKVAS